MSGFFKHVSGFSQLRIRTQLLFAFALLSAVILLTGGSGLLFTKRIGGTVEVFSDVTSPLSAEAANLVQGAQLMTLKLFEALMQNDASALDEAGAELNQFNTAAKSGLAQLETLSRNGGLDLDMSKAGDLEKEYRQQADQMIEASKRQIAEQAIAIERLAQFEVQRAALDKLLSDFISTNESTMAAREDGAKTLIQSGSATTYQLNEILVETFNQSYPMVQGAYKLLQYMVELQDNARSFLALESAEDLAAMEKKFNSNIKKVGKRRL